MRIVRLQQLPFRYLNSHDRPTLTEHAHLCHIYVYMHQLSNAYMQDICAQVRRAHVRIYTRNYSRCNSGCRAHVAPVSHHCAWRKSRRCRQQRRRFNRTPCCFSGYPRYRTRIHKLSHVSARYLHVFKYVCSSRVLIRAGAKPENVRTHSHGFGTHFMYYTSIEMYI